MMMMCEVVLIWGRIVGWVEMGSVLLLFVAMVLSPYLGVVCCNGIESKNPIIFRGLKGKNVGGDGLI